MSSGFPGGYPDFFNLQGGGVNDFGVRFVSMMNLNNNGIRNGYNPQGSYRSPLAGFLADPSSQVDARRLDLIGKRSLAEFQHQQEAAVYLRNVKPRPYNQQTSPVSPLTPMDLSISPEVSSCSSNSSSAVSVSRYGVPVVRQNAQSFNLGMMVNHQHNNQNQFSSVSTRNLVAKQSPVNQEMESMVMSRLQELEKQLLLDDEDGENDAISVVTNSEWSETIQNLLGPSQAQKPENMISPSPTTSSSSCASSSASPPATICVKQLILDTAAAIMDGKSDSAVEILTRLNKVSNARGTPEQRLGFYMATALRARVSEEQSMPAPELYGKEHVLSTQLLYDKSPCFKLAFMAANSTILEAVSGSGQPVKKIHVVDFDIGQGVQYVYLLHEIAAAREGDKESPISLKLTTFAHFGNGGFERLKLVGDGLKMVSNKLGVCFSFNISNLKLSDLSKAALMVENGDLLAVNFAFKLYRLPDESVTTDNLRDEVLRRVKSLSPAVVTMVEQEMNTNTASFTTRVNELCEYYRALFDSVDSTFPRDNPDRVRIEEGLNRRLINSVACEGRYRVERCEVFGKWRARMQMAGFHPESLSQLSFESLLSKLNSGTRGNPGFTVKEYSGGIRFGWMGRTLTVASAWH